MSYEGLIVGVTLKSTEFCEKYIVNDKEISIPGILKTRLIPGARGEHIWKKRSTMKNCLQGFFFVGPDAVDLRPGCLCYLASFPKKYSVKYIRKEIFSHTKEMPLHVISNP